MVTTLYIFEPQYIDFSSYKTVDVLRPDQIRVGGGVNPSIKKDSLLETSSIPRSFINGSLRFVLTTP